MVDSGFTRATAVLAAHSARSILAMGSDRRLAAIDPGAPCVGMFSWPQCGELRHCGDRSRLGGDRGSETVARRSSPSLAKRSCSDPHKRRADLTGSIEQSVGPCGLRGPRWRRSERSQLGPREAQQQQRGLRVGLRHRSHRPHRARPRLGGRRCWRGDPPRRGAHPGRGRRAEAGQLDPQGSRSLGCRRQIAAQPGAFPILAFDRSPAGMAVRIVARPDRRRGWGHGPPAPRPRPLRTLCARRRGCVRGICP
jgi:hypothetical protein